MTDDGTIQLHPITLDEKGKTHVNVDDARLWAEHEYAQWTMASEAKGIDDATLEHTDLIRGLAIACATSRTQRRS